MTDVCGVMMISWLAQENRSISRNACSIATLQTLQTVNELHWEWTQTWMLRSQWLCISVIAQPELLAG
jgi:hypothetical protein